MDNNETCKKSHEREKLDIGRREEDKASHDPELEEGEFRKDDPFGLGNLIHKGMVVSVQKLGSSTKGRASTWQLTSPERGSHQGDTSMENQLVNVIQSTCHRIYSEKHSQSYAPSSPIRSKERHEKRKHNCFSYHDYHQVLKKIKNVCSERLGNQLLHQSKDRKEFNTLIKEEELKFFKKHACSYRVYYERVIPTASYHRMKLPKLFCSILLKVFHKYMRSQLIKFVRRQINDRNKEKRIRERWIFEAAAGYLKKTFDGTSLTCSGFEMLKSECYVHAYSEGEQELKFLDMQSLTTEIEAIASSKELEETVTDKDNENLVSPIETNGGAEDELSVDATEGLVDSMSSHFNNAPTEFSEKDGTQVATSSPQNEGGNVERSCSRFVTDKTLELSKEVAADLGNEPPVRKKQRCMNPDNGALEGSCSGSQRNLPHESDSNIHETALRDEEEPQAERLPSANVNQTEQDDVAANKEVSCGAISSFGRVTKQHNITGTSAALAQPSTQLQLYDLTCQNVAHPCQESGVNTCSISTGLDNHGTLNIQQQSANQASSMVEHMPENGLQSDPATNGCRQLLMSSNHPSPPVRVTEQQIATSPPVQVTEQQNASNSSLLTPHVRQQYAPQTCQTIARQDQLVGRNSFPAQAWLDSLRSSNVQQHSNNQTTAGSTSGHYMLESGPQLDPLTIEMSRLLLMHDLMTKKHISKRQTIILECEKELAECKRKFDEKVHNLEMETLQKKKDIAILEDKICKQQMLGEKFQVLRKASAGVASCSQTEFAPVPASPLSPMAGNQRPPAPPLRMPRVGLSRNTSAGTLRALTVPGGGCHGAMVQLGAVGQGPADVDSLAPNGFESNLVISDAFLASQSSATAAQSRRRAPSTNKRTRDDEGDPINWNDQHTSLVCSLFAEQVRKGNRPNTHLNIVGYTEVNQRFFQCTGIMLSRTQLKNKWDKLKNDLTIWRKLMRKETGTGWNWDKGTINMDAERWKKIKAEIPGVEKFKNRPLQNEDKLKVMFGSIINEEIDHRNPMSSNPIISPSADGPHHIDLDNDEVNGEDNSGDMGGNNDLDNNDEVFEVSPTPSNAKIKARIILDKPNKKHKSNTTLVIQEHISNISESAQAFVKNKQAGITIDEVMSYVIACGADLGSDEHFVASELFVKKEQREMFMTIPTKEARFNWLNRKFELMFPK